MKPRPVAYIRKSGAEDPTGTFENQRDTVIRLAAARGDTLAGVADEVEAGRHPDYFTDFGISGGADEAHRPGYGSLLEEMTAGRISTVYVWNQSRIWREVEYFEGFRKLAISLGVAVVAPAGDLTSKALRATSRYTAVADAEHREATSDAMKASYARRRANGERAFGRVPYGYRREKVDGKYVDVVNDPEAIARVVDAYAETGSLNATSKRLNGAGIPSHLGRGWYPQAVAKIVEREAPSLREGRRGRGVRGDTRIRALSRLLWCPCGQVMSPTKMRMPDQTRWYCRVGAADATHNRPYGITERKVLPWIKNEAARLRLPSEVEMGSNAEYDDSEQRRGLEQMREAIGEDAYRLAVANLDATRAEHGDQARTVVDVPPGVDWSWTAEVLNTALRALFDHIQLGDDLMPVRAEWTVPEWRAAER